MAMLSGLGDEDLTRTLGLVLHPLVSRYHPNNAGDIVTALLRADRNEILGLIESPTLLESAINQVLPNLLDRGPLRLNSSINPRLLPSRKSGNSPGPSSTTHGGAGASSVGDHDDDQQES